MTNAAPAMNTERGPMISESLPAVGCAMAHVRYSADISRVALAWHWAKDVTAPIVGCSKTERVDDVIEALGVKLSESDIAYLEEPYTAHELVGPLARPGERALAGTLAPTLKEKAK